MKSYVIWAQTKNFLLTFYSNDQTNIHDFKNQHKIQKLYVRNFRFWVLCENSSSWIINFMNIFSIQLERGVDKLFVLKNILHPPKLRQTNKLFEITLDVKWGDSTFYKSIKLYVSHYAVNNRIFASSETYMSLVIFNCLSLTRFSGLFFFHSVKQFHISSIFLLIFASNVFLWKIGNVWKAGRKMNSFLSKHLMIETYLCISEGTSNLTAAFCHSIWFKRASTYKL